MVALPALCHSRLDVGLAVVDKERLLGIKAVARDKRAIYLCIGLDYMLLARHHLAIEVGVYLLLAQKLYELLDMFERT